MNPMLKRLMQRARLMNEADDQGGAGGSAAEEKFEYVIEGEDSSQTTEQQNNGEEDGEKKPEETPAQKNDEDEDEDEHEGEQSAPEGETDEEKRERRRKERQDRKARAREREESLRREVSAERRARQELEQRLASLEGRDRSRDIAQVDDAIGRADRAYENYKRAHAEAIEQHDGEKATALTEKMIEAREASRQLKVLKTNIEKEVKQGNRPTSNVEPDAEQVRHTNAFLKEHSWFRPGTNDADSRMLKQLDDMVAEEFDPRTPEYWDELRSRVKKYLPHRVASGKVTPADKSAPANRAKSVVGGGGGETTSAGKAVFTLSKERVQALKDAGVWDNPKEREAMIKSYRDYDKANKKG